MSFDTVKIGLLSVSDRASAGIYQDQGLPSLAEWLRHAVKNPLTIVSRVIPDERAAIQSTLIEFADVEACSLILTTGGTGPAPRDLTPDATLAVAERVMDGFGERMRQISLRFVPTAILSRQTAVIRGKSLIVNLPGQPKSIRETLEGLGYRNVWVRAGNGTLGWPDEAPFDRILVAAGGPAVPPPLFEQLAEGGRMVMPVGDVANQTLEVIEKAQGVMRVTRDSGCVFVKLVGKYAWES